MSSLKIHQSVSIDRGPGDVFDFVSDPANNSAWQGPTESALWTSEGAPEVGSTVYSVARILGKKIDFAYQVTRWDPPKALRFESLEGTIPFRLLWAFAPNAGGGTDVTLDAEAETSGFLKVAEGVVGRQFDGQLTSDFEKLKRVLEAQA